MACCFVKLAGGAQTPSKKTLFEEWCDVSVYTTHGVSTCHWKVGKCECIVGAECPTVADTEATPEFRVIGQMGRVVPEAPKGRISTLLIYSARVRGYDQVTFIRMFTKFCKISGS